MGSVKKRSEARRLVGRFGVVSLAAFLVTGGSVAWLMARAVRGQEETNATLHARTVALEGVAPILRPSDFAAPVTAARYRQLQAIVESRIVTDGRVVRVKLWRLDGTITYSDARAAVGRRFPDPEESSKISQGQVLSDISDLKDGENFTERSMASKLFETYVPIRFSAGGPVVGAVEIYQRYTFVQAEVSHLLTSLALAFGFGLAALYLVLMPIVLGTARRLRERNMLLTEQAQSLREAEAKYRALVESLPAIVYAAEFAGSWSWQYVSPQIEAILGFTPDEWCADPTLFDRQLHPDDVERYRTAGAQGHVAGGQLSVEYRMIARDGRAVWFRDEAIVIATGDGRPKLQQGVMFDISESKRAEEALRTGLEREQEASERLRALDKMRNGFLQAISHELRTPLTSVLGFALTLRRTDVSLSATEREEMLDRLAANARKLERMLSDLLDMDRLARGVLEPKLSSVDLGALVERVADQIDVGARRLVVEIPPGEVVADGAKLERIVESLLVNAVRHTPKGTRIWTRAGRAVDGFVISVEDDGPGVPDDMKEAVFQPFRQGDGVSEHNPGTGIGLALVAEFARLHGGRAWVEDRIGGGAAFRVYVPTSLAAVRAPAAGPEAGVGADANPPSLSAAS